MSDPLTKRTGHLVEGLTWTKEKPTVQGWYWARWPNNPGLGAEVLCVTQPHGPDTEYLEFDDTPLEEYIAEWHPQWSGPIPLPTDAPAQDWYKASEVEAWLQAALLPRSANNTVHNGVIDDLLDQLIKGRG